MKRRLPLWLILWITAGAMTVFYVKTNACEDYLQNRYAVTSYQKNKGNYDRDPLFFPYRRIMGQFKLSLLNS